MNHKLASISMHAATAPSGNAAANDRNKHYAKYYDSDGKPTFTCRDLLCILDACVGAVGLIIGAEGCISLTCALRALIKTCRVSTIVEFEVMSVVA
jgi:hypothetical protein